MRGRELSVYYFINSGKLTVTSEREIINFSSFFLLQFRCYKGPIYRKNLVGQRPDTLEL